MDDVGDVGGLSGFMCVDGTDNHLYGFHDGNADLCIFLLGRVIYFFNYFYKN